MSLAVTQICSLRKVFLNISQNLQKNTCARVSFLKKLQAWGNFIKKKALAKTFPMNFVKYFVFIEHHRRLLFEYIFI